MSIDKPEDWWKVFEEFKDGIADIVVMWGDIKREDFLALAERKDWEALNSVMNEAWFKAPDTPRLHNIPGWLAMCDLLSESCVFDPSAND